MLNNILNNAIRKIYGEKDQRGRAYMIQNYPVYMQFIPAKISNYRVNIDQNIFYTFVMKSARHRCSSRRGRIYSSHSQPITQPNSTFSQYNNIANALQTLDNQHSLLLLQTATSLPPALLCFKTSLAHSLNHHHLCFDYARQSLNCHLACPQCLSIYLCHFVSSCQGEVALCNRIIEAVRFKNDPDTLCLIDELVAKSGGTKRYESLLRELREQGGRLDKIQILEENRNSRKIVAKFRIDKKQTILFVPKARLITLQLARQLPIVQALFQKNIHLKSPKHTQLAIYLLYQYQLGDKSPFAQYMATLPLDFQHFPVNYPQNMLQQLKGCCFLQQIEHKKQDMRRDYDSLVSIDQTFVRFSFQKFIQARLLVSSRVFGVIIDRIKTDALVPVADMLNHHLPKQTSWYYCDRAKGFIIQSLREILPGTQVFDSYGMKCNSRFLLNYGFTLHNNPHNQIMLQITLPNIIADNNLPMNAKLKVNRMLESKGFQEMICLLRVAVQNNEDQSIDEQANGVTSDMLKQTPFKSIANQIRAWNLLQGIAANRLKDYLTTIQEDKKLLSKETDVNMINVIRLRLGQKEVWHWYQQMAKRVVKFLDSGGKRGEMKVYECYISSLQLQGKDD